MQPAKTEVVTWKEVRDVLCESDSSSDESSEDEGSSASDSDTTT